MELVTLYKRVVGLDVHQAKIRHYGAATPLVHRAWRRRRPCSSGELIL